MIPKILESDIRFRILNELSRRGHSVEQVSINDFLKTITTHKGLSDIGTIRRALEDLEESELIVQSVNHSGAKRFLIELNTSGTPAKAKTTERFDKEFVIDGVTYPQIRDMYFYLTLKGKEYIAQYEKPAWFKRNRDFILIIAGSLLAVTGGVAASYVSKQPEYHLIELEQIHTLDKDHMIIHKDSIKQLNIENDTIR